MSTESGKFPTVGVDGFECELFLRLRTFRCFWAVARLAEEGSEIRDGEVLSIRCASEEGAVIVGSSVARLMGDVSM